MTLVAQETEGRVLLILRRCIRDKEYFLYDRISMPGCNPKKGGNEEAKGLQLPALCKGVLPSLSALSILHPATSMRNSTTLA